MKIAVHTTPHLHKLNYAPQWICALKQKNVSVLECDFHSNGILQKIRQCSGALWHFFHTPFDKISAHKILTAIEYCMKVPVFPNFSSRWHFDEKTAQHYLLSSIEAPYIPSWIFWNKSDALAFLDSCEFPLVFKLSVGAGSANIIKLDTKKQTEKIIDTMFDKHLFPYSFNEFAHPAYSPSKSGIKRFVKRITGALNYLCRNEYPPLNNYYIPERNYVYFQQYLPDNTHDIRITVIGNRAFGFIRRNRPDDFRASGSGLVDHNPKHIPLEVVQAAHDISLKLGFQSMAYDFLKSPGGTFLINEISYAYKSETVEQCPGYWDRSLRWHDGHIKPEDAHIADFIAQIEQGRLQ
ncbi:MAG: hypothetical protein H7A34_02285 [bacterium]|nr:hypothetical protein [bacterium]